MLRRILYSSRAAEGVGLRDCYDIIRVSHNRNSQHGITGGLMLLDGYFFQLIEGLPHAIQARYDRIATDSRHADVVIRDDRSVSVPVMENDWMALRDGSKIEPSILTHHGYIVGCPQAVFSAERLSDLMLDCFGVKSAVTIPG